MFYSIYDNYGIIRLFACYATAYANSNEIYSYRAIFHIVGKIILQYAGFIISDNFPVIPLILAYSQMGTVADTLKILKLYKNSWNLTLIDQKWIVMPNDCHVYFLIGTEKKQQERCTICNDKRLISTTIHLAFRSGFVQQQSSE